MKKRFSRRPLLLSEIGEFELIKKIEQWCRLSRKKIHGLIPQVPLGDDAFVAKLSSNQPLVVSTDTLIEDTHFKLNWQSDFLDAGELWRCLGYKSMAVNLSDLASMGDVHPLCAFVTLGLDGDISVNCVDKLYTGMKQACRKHHFFIAGGDIIHSEKSMVSVAVLGQLQTKKALRRKGARINDVLMTTGPLGLAAVGLKILTEKPKLRSIWSRKLVSAHLLPEPKLTEGAILGGKDNLATSAIDLSDDLITSLEILREKNGIGFEIPLESVPIDPSLAQFCKERRLNPLDFVLYGGEDYQLLFTIPVSKVEAVKRKIPAAFVLGRVMPESYGIQLKLHEHPFQLKDRRFKHF